MFKVLMQFAIPPILLILSLLLRRLAGKSPRLRIAWALLSLWLAPFLISFLPVSWNPGIDSCRNIAHTLLELAAIQLAAVAVFDIAFRRVKLNKLVSEGAIGTMSVVVLVNLLYELGVTATGILLTAAASVAIVAFALQDLISSIVGGVVLAFSGGIKPGDYIECGEWSGWIESFSLRQTTIKNTDGDAVVLPNSQLCRMPVRICAPMRRRIVTFVVPHGVDSQEIIETVEFAMRASPIEGIAIDPPPACTIQEMAVSGVTFAIAIWVTGPGNHDVEASAALTRIGFALDRAGLPRGDFVHAVEVRSQQKGHKQPLTPVEILRRAPILRLLDEDDLKRLVSSLRKCSFGPGEYIVRQGEPGESMYFIGKGKVSILFKSGEGTERQVALMEGGDFFGEASLLTGEARSATVQALSRVDCYELPKEGLEDFIRRRSELVEDIATVMARRQIELRQLREKLSAETIEIREAEARRQFLSSVRRFFGGAASPAAEVGRSSKPQEQASTPEAPVAKAPNPAVARSEQRAPLVPPPVKPETAPVADAFRGRAARLLEEGKYTEALHALAEADDVEKELAGAASRHKNRGISQVASPRKTGTVDKAMKIVARYSKIAAGAGLVPGALINFVAILAVQVTMVWKIARCFGYKEPVERVRGSILSLLVSGIPAALGHGTALAVTATAAIGGTILYFLFTPVLAYAVTQAVGRTFVMHFESGGTLLTFDATAFQEYFLREFHQAQEKFSAQKSAAA